jgi:glycosyltransferase involved in cell wall biosynthesis
MSTVIERTGFDLAPKLSVIIPTYNRASVLARCLKALLVQKLERDGMEIIVADDGSTDTTRATVDLICRSSSSSAEIRYVYQQNTGANAARNRAIQMARGSILLLINDDTIPIPEMVSEHMAAHERFADERVAVLGRVTALPELPRSPLTKLHLDRAFDALGNAREFDWRAFYTCNVSVKKSLLDKAGLFEESIRYHEDLELSERLSHYGLRVVYCPSALGFHDHLLTESEYLKIAAREAQALTVWVRKAPHLRPVLGTLGFEPALPFHIRLRHRLIDAAFNKVTIPFWMSAARNCPKAFSTLALRLYLQTYGSTMRANLRRALQAPSSTRKTKVQGSSAS